jgi:DNA-directed RNA polymerase subunit RPC12/RpoP
VTNCTQCGQPFDTDPEWEERYCNPCRTRIAQQEHEERLANGTIIPCPVCEEDQDICALCHGVRFTTSEEWQAIADKWRRILGGTK